MRTGTKRHNDDALSDGSDQCGVRATARRPKTVREGWRRKVRESVSTKMTQQAREEKVGTGRVGGRCRRRRCKRGQRGALEQTP